MKILKTTILLFGMLAVNFSSLTAQTCPEFNLLLSSQTQVNNFASTWPGCTEFNVNILIQTGSQGPVINLDSLSQIKKINGNLNVRFNSGLNNIHGLSSLEEVNGNLEIQVNGGLKHFHGLNHLKHVQGDLKIEANPSLENMEGLNDLESISGEFFINRNRKLVDLTGLEKLETIGGDLQISENDTLTNIIGLSKLDFIGGNLTLGSNFILESLNGFEKLSSNPIPGIDEISIKNNYKLTSLKPIQQMELRAIKLITITGNIKLSECTFQNTCDFLASCNLIVLKNNKEDECNSIDKLKSLCSSSSEISYAPMCFLSIYPNPVNDILYFKSNGGFVFESANYEIIDRQNRLLESGYISNNSFDVSELNKGIYILRLRTDTESRAFRFVKL